MYSLFYKSSQLDTLEWDIQNVSIDFIVGALASGYSILNKTQKSNEYYFDSNINVSEYKLIDDVDSVMIPLLSQLKLNDNEFGIWMDNNENKFTLYKFYSDDFFNGVLTVADKLDYDYRSLFYGLPFDSKGRMYNIDIDDKLLFVKGYTMVIDIDDVDLEEAYDENIIEPYARVDDITEAFNFSFYDE